MSSLESLHFNILFLVVLLNPLDLLKVLQAPSSSKIGRMDVVDSDFTDGHVNSFGSLYAFRIHPSINGNAYGGSERPRHGYADSVGVMHGFGHV